MPAIRLVPYGLVFLLLVLCACDDEKKSKRTSDAGPAADSGSVPVAQKAQGLIIDADTRAPIAGASLTTNDGGSAKSDGQGEFTLVVGDKDRYATVTRESFAPTERALPASGGSLTVLLKSVDERTTFRGDKGTTVELATGVRLEIPKDAVLDAEGKKVPGEVTLELAVVDGQKPEQAGALPGDMSAEQKNGKTGRLSVETGLSIRIFDAKQTDLTVDKNADVVAEVPAREAGNKTLAVYSYGKKEQRWKEEGSAEVSTSADKKPVYRAKIEHLSWWSLGRFFDGLSCVRACVEGESGEPAQGAQLWVVGASAPGVSQFFTREDGCGAGDVIAEASVVVVGQVGTLVSQSVRLETGPRGPSVAKDASECVDAGTLRLGQSASASCALCSIEAGPPGMDAGKEPTPDASLDATLPSADAAFDGSSPINDSGLLSEAGGPAPTTLIEQAFLKASNADSNDSFGSSISISGNTLVVGAPNERSNATVINGSQTDNSASNAGAAYVFVRTGNTWTQQAYLKASNAQANDTFGRSVSIDGDTIVVGAPGEDSDSVGVDGALNENAAGAGAAYVFVRSGSTWTQEAFLKASNTDADDAFGTSVAISNNTIVVGAPFEDSADSALQEDDTALSSGAAYVFFRSGGTWVPTRYLKASNLEADDQFGGDVAIDASTILVSALGEDSGLPFEAPDPNPNDNTKADSGAVYVFVENGTTWSQQAYIKAINPDPGDAFGESIAISVDTIVIGASSEDSAESQINGDAPSDNSAQSNGAAYVYSRTGTSWSFDTYLKARNGRTNHDFGDSVSIDGPFIVVGAFQDDSPATTINGDATQGAEPVSVGSAFLYQRTPVGWVEKAYLKGSNSVAGDWFGKAVGVSGLTTICGAVRQGGTAGAVYVYLDQST